MSLALPEDPPMYLELLGRPVLLIIRLTSWESKLYFNHWDGNLSKMLSVIRIYGTAKILNGLWQFFFLTASYVLCLILLSSLFAIRGFHLPSYGRSVCLRIRSTPYIFNILLEIWCGLGNPMVIIVKLSKIQFLWYWLHLLRTLLPLF